MLPPGTGTHSHVTAGIPAASTVWLWMLLEKGKGAMHWMAPGFGNHHGACTAHRQRSRVCLQPLLPGQVCFQDNTTDVHVQGLQPSPVWILVQAITSPCALQKVEYEHCPSLGFMTPEGLRLMRKSCPPRPLGPSLPTQALLSCSEQQAPALLPVVFLLWGTESPSFCFLRVTGWYY